MERVGAHAPGPAVQPTSVASVGLRAPPSSTATIDDQQAAALLTARNKQREDAQRPRVLSARDAAVHRLTHAYCQRVRRELEIECSGEVAMLEEGDVNDLFTATVVRLRADSGPEQVHLLIETASRWDTVLLAENSLSEFGASRQSIKVNPDEAAPSSLYAAVVEYGWYDADFGGCNLTGERARNWVVCRLEGGQPRCAQVALARYTYEYVSSNGQVPHCSRERVTGQGFSRRAHFNGSRLTFKPDPLPYFSTPTKAPASQALTLEQVFAADAMPSSQR